VSDASANHHCSTCADAAERATIMAIDGANADARLASGDRQRIAIDVTPGVAIGDVVLVHQGVAIGIAPTANAGDAR